MGKTVEINFENVVALANAYEARLATDDLFVTHTLVDDKVVTIVLLAGKFKSHINSRENWLKKSTE